MRKKIVIGIVVIVAVALAALYYLNSRNRTLSPPGSAELTSGDLTVSVSYSRPSVRGRLIFGSEEEGALQPYGKYWRLGANEATEISFSRDVQVNGQPLKAGKYRFYAVPGADSFEIIVNTELGKWGAFEPDHTMDILKFTVPVEKLTAPVEQHTISLVSAESGVNLLVEWADVRVVIPVR